MPGHRQAMFAVTLAVLDRGVALDDPAAIVAVMGDVDVDVIADHADGTNRVFLSGTDVSDRIRTAEVDLAAAGGVRGAGGAYQTGCAATEGVTGSVRGDRGSTWEPWCSRTPD